MPRRLTALFGRQDVLAANRVMKWAQRHGFIFHHTEPDGFQIEHLVFDWLGGQDWVTHSNAHYFKTFTEAALAAVRAWDALTPHRRDEAKKELARLRGE